MDLDSGAPGSHLTLAQRARELPAGIAAAVVAWQREIDGATTARLRLSDGRRLGWVDVRVPAGPLPHGDVVERWVEREAGALPPADRLAALETRSPLAWPRS